ncbi:MAG: D-cysteine desulfhydrase family protein [bacterium]|nr:D-cysteine desulfhydrase family protein [bacterium]
MISIEEALSRYPREILTRTPTPLDYLPHLSEQLQVEFYIKRDDLTDLALGGDKPRKLEYELARARAEGADTLVTCGSSQSNHARLTTAAARKLGMKCAVVLSDDAWNRFQGNLLTVYLMGARVEVVQTEDHWDLEEHALKLCDELQAAGDKPYYIPVSGTTPTSSLGYVRAALEIIEQLEAYGVKADAIYVPFGTGGMFSALLLTLREKGIDCPIIGISVNRRQEDCYANLDKWWCGICELLDRDPERSRGLYEIHDQFIGKEYGVPTEAGLDAILTMAQAEGILLDPVYSGKTFSGFLAHHQEGRWQPGQRILLQHSGGTPALFAYHEPLRAHLQKRGMLP